MARKTLTDRQIEALKATDKRRTVADPLRPGLYVRVSPSGSKSFAVVTRNPSGRQVWATVGPCAAMPIADARRAAVAIIDRIKAGQSAIEQPPPPPATLADVSADWLKRHVDARGVRTAPELRRVLNRYILPQLGAHTFTQIRRGDIARMMDVIEDENGKRQADVALMILRNICNWYATRNDDYLSPIVRGMRRAAPPRRNRILTDDELRAIWQATESGGPFAGFVRLGLLTAQRREKILTMRWADLDGSAWTIPSADREKGTAGELVLPALAMETINAQPLIVSCPYVLAGRTDRPYSGMSKSMARLQRESGVTGWTPHDLRRTARSLMARAAVRPNVAERVLGHVQPGVAGIYDRHTYTQEKADALARLAGLVQTIIDPPTSNVVQLAR